ncbi:MAG: hypothetical protein HY077_16560 [Elusimicrobia bacterium]|nr:hypothetical protein [Elusimicrobiota bacterium]
MPEQGHAPSSNYSRAFQHHDRNEFPEAEAFFGRAISDEPADPELYKSRSRVRLFLGDAAGAERDGEEAFRRSGARTPFLEFWLQVLLLRGASSSEVESLLSRAGLSPAAKAFWRACFACRRKKHAAARAGFERAAALAGEDLGLADLARLFRCAVMALTEGAPPRPRGPELAMVGLGYRKVLQMSVGGVRTLAGQDVLAVVCNAADDLVLRFLGLFGVPIKFLVFRGTEAEARRGTQALLKECAGRRRAALVTRGHPLVFGLLGGLILEEARRRGVPCRVWDGVSGFDELPAAAGIAAGRPGMQVVGCFAAGESDRGLPMVAYAPKERGGLEALSAVLAGRYPAGTMGYAMANSGPREFQAKAVPIRDLSEALGGDLPCAIYVP